MQIFPYSNLFFPDKLTIGVVALRRVGGRNFHGEVDISSPDSVGEAEVTVVRRNNAVTDMVNARSDVMS